MSDLEVKIRSFFKKPSYVVAVIAGVILLAAAGSSLFVVDQAEQAVITRFGRYYATLGPGLQYKIPFIDKNLLFRETKLSRRSSSDLKPQKAAL